MTPRRGRFCRRAAEIARRALRAFPWLSLALSSPAILLFIVAVLLGCAPAGGEEQRVRIESGAVEVVGSSDVIARVVDLQPAADGRVWLLNSIEPYFVVLGPDGRVEREFGRAGGGPGEFGAPLALVHDPGSGDVLHCAADGTLWLQLFDAVTGRIWGTVRDTLGITTVVRIGADAVSLQLRANGG
jgi:hypothetical protein